jgi:hypothetical protein
VAGLCVFFAGIAQADDEFGHDVLMNVKVGWNNDCTPQKSELASERFKGFVFCEVV